MPGAPSAGDKSVVFRRKTTLTGETTTADTTLMAADPIANVMREAFETFRRPAYTGERRCWPCTVLNTGLLGLACAFIARSTPIGSAAIGVAGGAAIAFRGYFVPYTPQVAPRLVDALPFEFPHPEGTGGRPSSDRSDDSQRPLAQGTDSLSADEPAGGAVTEQLLDAGVLVAEGEALALDDAFETRWREAMDDLRVLDDEALATAAADAAATGVEGRLVDDEYAKSIVLGDENTTMADEAWLSRPVTIAEAAAVQTLADREGGFDPETCRAAARPLRMFLEKCPDCGSPVRETTTAACCGSVTTPGSGPRDVLACPTCDEQLFTFPAKS